MAIEPEATPPRIRHQNIRPFMGKFKMLWTEFSKHVLKTAEQKIKAGEIPWADVTVDNLVAQRKNLASAIRRGMHERKDREEQIAFAAAVVWFLRLEKDRQDRILEIW